MSRNLRLAVAVLSWITLASCRSYDPALVEQIKEVWDAPAAQTIHANRDPQPWRVGQWVSIGIDDEGTRAVRTVLVAKKEGSGHWLEVHDVWPEHESRAALLVEGYRPGETSNTKVLRVKYRRPGGEVLDVEPDGEESAEAAEIKAKVDFLLDLLELRHTSGRIEDVSVGAGTFTDAVKKSFVVTAGGEKWLGSIWYTNAVPVTAWARVESRTPYLEFSTWRRSLQVVAFGDAGVSSVLFD